MLGARLQRNGSQLSFALISSEIYVCPVPYFNVIVRLLASLPNLLSVLHFVCQYDSEFHPFHNVTLLLIIQ
jgi:hypothetical protein